MRCTRQERLRNVFYVICRDYVNMLKFGGNARKACDMLVTCTWGVCKLYM